MKCPTCGSPDPKRHPAMQWEGEVQVCRDPFHPLTADTITDEQIRSLAPAGCDRKIRALCKVALNDAPTYLRASVVRNARARCAEILNARAAKVAATLNALKVTPS